MLPTVGVTLVVRTFSGALSTLLPFLRSAELFWPVQRWPVVIVLDAEAEEDWWVSMSLLPTWVRVVLEPLPPGRHSWAEMRRGGSKQAGWQRVAWSQFHLDSYGTTEFVAQMDADTLFHTFVTEDLLFGATVSDSGVGDNAQLRPHITGLTLWSDFGPALRALRLQEDIDFMASQPMVLRREHFASARQYVVEQMGAAEFDEAFARLTHAVLANETSGSTTIDGKREASGIRFLPCQQSVMGSYLWQFHRAAYTWHIMWRQELVSGPFPRRAIGVGGPYARPPAAEFRCPQLYVASHLSCWGDAGGTCVDLKGAEQGGARKGAGSSGDAAASPGLQGGQAYMLKSAELLTAALCGARSVILRRVRAAEDAELADSLIGAHVAGRGAAPGGAAARTPEALCAAALRRQSLEALLLGLSNSAFWPPGRSGGGACPAAEELLARWEQSAGDEALARLRGAGAGRAGARGGSWPSEAHQAG